MNKTFYIYALCCPVTQVVRYVGSTYDLLARNRSGRSKAAAEKRGRLVQDWFASLGRLDPYRIVLESGTEREVILNRSRTLEQQKRGQTTKRTGPNYKVMVKLSHIVESKWQLRFRHTIFNQHKLEVKGIEAWLRNDSLPWENL